MAVIIDHMTPPFDRAGLNRELRELAALINDYTAAREKSPALAETRLKEINAVSKKMGLLTDLKIGEIRTEAGDRGNGALHQGDHGKEDPLLDSTPLARPRMKDTAEPPRRRWCLSSRGFPRRLRRKE